MDQNLLDLCVKEAKKCECPAEQVKNLVGRGYIPLPWQWKFHAIAREADKDNGPVDIGVGGARGPGKSHGVFSQITLDDCQRVQRLKGLFLRQTGKAAKESFEDLIGNALRGKAQYQYNATSGVISFPNGSRVLLGGFENERDVDKYIGIEYDVIAVEERNQLRKARIEKLKGSLRTSKSGWRPRMYSSFNPGGIGHADVKEAFVIPYRENQEKKSRFIPSTYRENPHINKEYVEWLDGLEGDLGKAWRDGDFDLFQGQYFSEWRQEKHVIKPFEIPITWKKYRAYDHGRTNPATCGWYTVDYDGNVYVYRELYKAGWDVDQLAFEIDRLSKMRDPITGKDVPETYEYSVADPSIFAKMGFVDRYGGQTIAETFARYGIMWLPASNRRLDGWNLMHQYLRWDEKNEPKIKYFSTCRDSIRTIPNLIHDELHPEDVNTDGEDHCGDRDRYFLLTLHERKSEKPKTSDQKAFEEIKRKESPITQEMYMP